MFNQLPNFKPIFFNSVFLSLDEARLVIQEKMNDITVFIRLDQSLWMDDDGLFTDEYIDRIYNRMLQARDDLSYLRDQIRCWDLENI